VVYIPAKETRRGRGRLRQKCLCRCLRAHTWTAQQLHSARRSASSIPGSPRRAFPSSSFRRPAASRVENFDTRGAGRSFARSKLHPLRARRFNSLQWPSLAGFGAGFRFGERVLAASPRDVSICRAEPRTYAPFIAPRAQRIPNRIFSDKKESLARFYRQQ